MELDIQNARPSLVFTLGLLIIKLNTDATRISDSVAMTTTTSRLIIVAVVNVRQVNDQLDYQYGICCS
jgi:hypothetical protein